MAIRLFEDFVPVSAAEAIVTTGEQLNRLDRIEVRRYGVHGDRVSVEDRGKVLVRAEGLRLGGVFEGVLVYSLAGEGIVGLPELGPSAHQPFRHAGRMYYTDGPLEEVTIYRDGEPFLGAFGDMVQVGNPCWAGDALYFEARDDAAPDRPDLWTLCRWDGRSEPELLRPGANPAAFGGLLFWGEWNGRAFDYRSEPLP